MDLFHIEHQGKSARVTLRSLPAEQGELKATEKTSVGEVTALKVTNGVNVALDAASLKPDALIAADPELDLDAAGEVLEPESLSTAFYLPTDPARAPVSDFKQLDLVFDAQGQEKERRPHLTRKANISDVYPVKTGKRIPVDQALKQFVFRQTYQVVHEDGVTRDFLLAIARELHEKQEMAVLGAGAKGNLPLVLRDKGSPYRAFLYGEIGEGEKYKLLVLLSDQELKRPAVSAPAPP